MRLILFFLFSALSVTSVIAFDEHPDEYGTSVYSKPAFKIRIKVENSFAADHRHKALPLSINIQRLEPNLRPSIPGVQKHIDGLDCTVSGRVNFNGFTPLTPYDAFLIAVPEEVTFGISVQPYGNKDPLSDPIVVTFPQKQGATLFSKYDIPVSVPAMGPACLEVTLRMNNDNRFVSATGMWF